MDTLDTLLLSCGTKESRSILRSIFEESFNILEADNSLQTKLLLSQNINCIAAILLDISKKETIDALLLNDQVIPLEAKSVPVIIISEDDEDPEFLTKAFSLGATDVIPLRYDSFALQHRVMNLVELHMHKQHMEKMVEEQASILRHSNDAMVDALSSIIEYRSAESGYHILRIRRFTQILLEEVARSCPEYNLTEATISIISSAAALHDIGKISIPDAILNKPGRLTAEEWTIMKDHVLTGCHILESLEGVSNEEYLRYAHNICHYHHERWNGGGYPNGLVGDNIPICAQVVGLADAYDALTTKRVYKDAYPFEQALNMILGGECGVFSPKLLECFKHVSSHMEEVAAAYADGLSPKTEQFNPTLPPPDRKSPANTLNAVQKKYQSLLHYMDIAVIEADIDQRLYHMLYNPYPELAPLAASSTLAQVQQSLLQQLIVPEQRQQMEDFLSHEIPDFLKNGLRRTTHQFLFRSTLPPYSAPYKVTMLRPSPNDEEARNILFLCQKLNPDEPAETSAQEPISIPSFFCRNDRWLTLETVDPLLLALTGFSPEEMEQQFQNRLLELVAPEDRDIMRSQLTERFSQSREVLVECRLQHKDGHPLWVQNRCRLCTGENGCELIHGAVTDISALKQQQTALQTSLDLYETILSQTGDILFEWEYIPDTIQFSSTWKTVFGYDPITANIRTAIITSSHFHPNDIPAFMEHILALERGEAHQVADVRIVKSDGRYLWCRFRSTGTYDENRVLQRITGIITNVDAEKHAERELQDRAERDSLTKLLNKHTARKQAEDYLSSFPQGAQCAMLILDLDNFKQVNDQYGHMFGDAVLSQAAREIRRLFRPNDIVARIGGDEFLILMCGTSDRKLVEGRCAQLVRIFGNLFRGQLPENVLGCSIGVALSPEHSSTYTELFQQADQALYQAKARGKNKYVLYDSNSAAFRFNQNAVSVIKTRIDSDEEPDLAGNNLAQHAFQMLYKATDTERAVQEILELAGQQTNVSRVYIFENTPDNRFCCNTFEWCNEGIPSEKDSLQYVSYETDIPGYEKIFDERGVFYCSDVAQLPAHLREILEPQGIKSMLQCAIWDGGVFRGYVGFDDCATTRLWTKDQLQILSFLAEVLSTFLLKKRAQDETQQLVNDMLSVLDNQNVWIYVIGPDDYRLQFLNAKVKELAPDAKPGMLCYQALNGLDHPCPDCPLKHFHERGSYHQVLENKKFGLRVIGEATQVRWSGRDAFLISCHDMLTSDFYR